MFSLVKNLFAKPLLVLDDLISDAIIGDRKDLCGQYACIFRPIKGYGRHGHACGHLEYR